MLAVEPFTTQTMPATLREPTDAELLQRFQASGDAAAFGQLYERYYHLAFGAALKTVQNSADAEDVVSATFETLHRKLPTVGKIASFKSYLYTTIRNAGINVHRRAGTQRTREEQYKNFEKTQQQFVESDPFERPNAEADTRDRVLTAALKQLRDDQRTCLRLFYFENLSYQQITERTDYDLKTVKSCLQNGKRNLRREFETLLRNPMIWLFVALLSL